MNLDDLLKTLNNLDDIDPKLIEEAGITKHLDKFRKKLIREGKKEFEDGSVLRALVELIEIMGISQKQSFKFVHSNHISEAKAKKLWFDTQKDNPDMIKDLRQQQASNLVSDYMQWLIKHLNGEFPPPYSSLHTYALSQLKTNEPELFSWALEKAYLEFYDIKNEDFDPDYKRRNETLEIDLLSFQKQIADLE